MLSRRHLLATTLLGTGYFGLRTLATGLPASFFLNPKKAMADGVRPACASKDDAQYVIFNTSGAGDPMNASVPGTYEDPAIVHSTDPALAPAPLVLGGATHTAAAPWAALSRSVLDRTCFFHLMTTTPVHPKEPDVLKLMEATTAKEMLPSLLAKYLAPCLGTIQAEPLSLGAASPSEGLTYGGQALPIVPALALKATLTNPPGPLTDLQGLRDQTLNQLYDVYRNGATPAERAYLDSLVVSQSEVRNIRQDLLEQLASIADNSAASQIVAAITLIQMNVTPVIAIHIPFGGDNHRDIALATETAETISGIQTIGALIAQLDTAGLADKVTFASLNVFGRTLGPGNADGRQHNPNHQTSVLIGKPWRSGVIGGVGPVSGDYGALPIDSRSGAGTADGDISAADTLPSFGKTLLASIGLDDATISNEIAGGQVVTAALA